MNIRARLRVGLAIASMASAAGCTNTRESADVEDSVAELSQGLSRADGKRLFFKPFPGTKGNGRACETCHVAEDSFQLTPARVEARWQALQERKCEDPAADDPLFRSIDADDHAEDFTLLRKHALVRVVIPLPTAADGSKLVWPVDDPDADSVELFRATPTILDSALTAPYQYDGRFATLQEQALAALHGHSEIQREPEPRLLDAVAAFQRTQFSSERAAATADALEHGSTPPDTDPYLSELEQHGKQLFERACGICHGGPSMTQLIPELAGVPGVRDIFLSKPVPPFAEDLPFAPSPVQSKLRAWAVRVPDKAEPEVRWSTDPGMVLQTGNITNFNEFDIPSLFGIANTAPYFRDNSAQTLADVVRQYQLVFEALRRVIPADVPFPQRPDALADEDIPALVAFLETL